MKDLRSVCRSGMDSSSSPAAAPSASLLARAGDALCLRVLTTPGLRAAHVLSATQLWLRARPVFSGFRVGDTLRLGRPQESRAECPAVPASARDGGTVRLPGSGLAAPPSVGEDSFLLTAVSPASAVGAPGPGGEAGRLDRAEVKRVSNPAVSSSFTSLTTMAGFPSSQLCTAPAGASVSWGAEKRFKVRAARSRSGQLGHGKAESMTRRHGKDRSKVGQVEIKGLSLQR